MRRYAEATAVPIARSRQEIDRLLREWGAEAIQWSDDFKGGRVSLRFLWVRDEARYIARFTIMIPTDEQLASRATDGRSGRFSETKLRRMVISRGRQEHRLLLLWLKAALNAVEGGLVSPAAIFLPFLEGSNGKTVGEEAIPRLEALLTSTPRALLPESFR